MRRPQLTRVKEIEELASMAKIKSTANKRLLSGHRKSANDAHGFMPPLKTLIWTTSCKTTYKGRVVLHGDVVKDDSSSYDAFTEQRSSASRMTIAKVLDVISRLPGCAGQAGDAVSAYTQV